MIGIGLSIHLAPGSKKGFDPEGAERIDTSVTGK